MKQKQFQFCNYFFGLNYYVFDFLCFLIEENVFLITDPFLRQFETLEENIAIVRGAGDDVSTVLSDIITVSIDVSTQSVPERERFVELVNATSGVGEGLQDPKEEERVEEKITSEHEQRCKRGSIWGIKFSYWRKTSLVPYQFRFNINNYVITILNKNKVKNQQE